MTLTEPAAIALEDLKGDGFHVVETARSAAEIAAIRSELTHLMEVTPFGDNSFVGTRTKRQHSMFAKTRVLDELATDPLVLEIVATLLGDALLSATVACEIHPGETAQPVHFDDGIYPLPADHRDVSLSALWAIDDFTADNGGTVIFPTRHGDRSMRPEPSEGRVVEMPAGSVLLYTGTLWHGGGANTSADLRLAVILTYVESWLRPQDSHLISVPVERARTLAPQLRALLGYSMRPPFLGYVHGLDPSYLFDAESTVG